MVQRMTGFENSLERDCCLFDNATHCCLGSFEPAEDDLVFAHDKRAEVTNRHPVSGERRSTRESALVQRSQVGLLHTGPETLGEVLRRVTLGHGPQRTDAADKSLAG